MRKTEWSYKPVLGLSDTSMWLFLLGIALVLVGKDLLAEGMFVDGVVYACISRNMACGMGDFWHPFYTQTIGPVFHSHPPLAFGLEALMFKAFGDHFFVERLYSLLTFALNGLLIALIWKRTTNNLRWAWLPLLYWVAMPLVTWSAKSNMLENTMTVFVLLSVFLMLVSYQNRSRKWLFMAGVMLFAAFLSKGFTGLFPLAFPLVYCIINRQRYWSQGLVDSLLLLVTLAVMAGLMFLLFPPSFAYMKDYVQLQVIGGGLHDPTVTSRFFIVLSLLQQLVLPVVLVAVVFVVGKLTKVKQVRVFEFPPDKKRFLLFLILGLTGVLPIMVSVKQRDFYMVAAMPFFALALGHASISLVNTIRESLKPNRLRHGIVLCLSCAVLVGGLVITWSGRHRYCRDEALINNVKEVLAVKGDEWVLGIDPADFNQWAWHAYFMRFGKVSLDDQIPDRTIYAFF